jgi:hypothetical protein
VRHGRAARAQRGMGARPARSAARADFLLRGGWGRLTETSL